MTFEKRTKLIVGNWKMHKSLAQGREDFALCENLAQAENNATSFFPEIGIAAPALMLPPLSSIARNVKLYAQNAHWAAQGAFTGETPVAHLAELRLTGSVIGHSERRQMNGETNTTAGMRMGALLSAGLECILCVGETLEQREAGKLQEVLRQQLFGALDSAHGMGGRLRAYQALGALSARPLLSIAYEPVWAIGTGRAASVREAQEAHCYLRALLVEFLGEAAANRIRILYGGSVNLKNAAEYFSCPDIDGALVGGASLNLRDFVDLCKKAILP